MNDTIRHEQPMRLKPIQVPGFPRPIPIEEGLALGRAEANDVSLPEDVFPSVSQHHARVLRDTEGLWVEDLGSRNGTLVNGEPIASSRRVRIGAGDVVQLGAIGPRFVVVSGSPLSETMFVDPSKVERKRIDLSKTAVTDLRQALGVPDDVGVDELVRRRARRTQLVGSGLILVATIALATWAWNLSLEGRETDDRLAEHMFDARARQEQRLDEVRREYRDELEVLQGENEKLTELVASMQTAETERQRDLSIVRTSFESERERLERDRIDLQGRLRRLENEGNTSSALFADLQRELADALDGLELLDPVNLAQARLREVRRVRAAVVLLEVELHLRNRESGRLLHVEEIPGASLPNFEGRGEPWTIESTGSGFCVSSEGWIITNAHVVTPAEADPTLVAMRDLDIEPLLEISAVFSDTSARYPVRVVRVASGPDEDLALVKIVPFDGMPFIESFSVDVAPPETGSDVFLFGFPLGNYALQQGDTVIASTFRGILSRVVDSYIQVDAGVHPGNSGGPVTDGNGRVIGVVFSVQAMPDHSAVYTIGYAIPIADARAVWPPPSDWDR